MNLSAIQLNELWGWAVLYAPIGILGIWRWSVWSFKKIVARSYKPVTGKYSAPVAVITPVYNEDPTIFLAAINSWQANNPSEIIAVIDASDKDCIAIFKKFSQDKSHCKLIVTDIPGKRPALAMGIRAANSAIVALVDSDTIWENTVIKSALPPFKDSTVGGVGTRQNELERKTIAQILFDIQLDLRYTEEMPFLSAAGRALTCLSGRTAFYRRKTLLPILDEMVNEKFWGKQVISGEDKRLTYLVLRDGWNLAFQQNARVYTPGAPDIKTFLKQRLRWTRNSWRADLRALWQGWIFRHKALTFLILDRFIQPYVIIISPIYLFVAIRLGHFLPALILFGWWQISRSIRLSSHLKLNPRHFWIVTPYIAFTFLTALIRMYALFTLNQQGWITRWHKSRLPQLSHLRQIPAYAATLATIFMLTSLVSTYKVSALQLDQTSNDSIPVQEKIVLGTSDTNTAINDNIIYADYLFKSGDSLVKIADRYNVYLHQIKLLNPSLDLNNELNLIGKKIMLPLHSAPLESQSLNLVNSSPPRIVYKPTDSTIYLNGSGARITLQDIYDELGDAHLIKLGDKEWLLKTKIRVGQDVHFIINKDEVDWLKLSSTPDSYTWIITYDGRIFIDGVTISSWNPELNDYDREHEDGRSFILARNDARMDIVNSDLSYLGHFPPISFGGNYGVAWRIKSNEAGNYLATGEVRNSNFHHNYFGAYTFGATGMLWFDNEFYNNESYGLDPHDDSNNFIVQGNVSHHNGKHGIIFSKRCLNNTVRNNISFDNNGHGIMLHADSHNNTVTNNEVFGNTDGIAIYRSDKNIISGNLIYNNDKGIRINEVSNANSISGNVIKDNIKHGIILYGQANNTSLINNQIISSKNGITVKTNNNLVSDNYLQNNGTALNILDTTTGNTNYQNKIY